MLILAAEVLLTSTSVPGATGVPLITGLSVLRPNKKLKLNMDPDPKLFYPIFLPNFFQKFSPGENYQILEMFCYYK